MKRFKWLILIVMAVLVIANFAIAEEKKEYQEGRYFVIEGQVSNVVARSLVINGQQFPISMYAQVFDINGNKLSVQLVANIGKIDKAKVYVLGGKVEKIVVLENI
jgi:uncharacterized protein YxeA